VLFPHTVTGELAPTEPPLADVLWFIAPGLPQVVDPSPPKALRLLPHTVIGAFTAMLEASVLDDPAGGMVTPSAGVPAVVPQSDGPEWAPMAVLLPHTVIGAWAEMAGVSAWRGWPLPRCLVFGPWLEVGGFVAGRGRDTGALGG